MTDITNAIQPILDLVGLTPAKVQTIIVYWFAVQMLLKLLATWLQKRLNALVAYVIETVDRNDDRGLRSLLDSAPYRWLRFVADFALRVKLPVASDIPPTS
jgi:hypothetical protein